MTDTPTRLAAIRKWMNTSQYHGPRDIYAEIAWALNTIETLTADFAQLRDDATEVEAIKHTIIEELTRERAEAVRDCVTLQADKNQLVADRDALASALRRTWACYGHGAMPANVSAALARVEAKDGV